MDALPDYSEEFTYDELIRIPDILCGIISDYNINTNELSGEKQRKGVERIIIENSYISIYRFKKNGMAKVTIENEL